MSIEECVQLKSMQASIQPLAYMQPEAAILLVTAISPAEKQLDVKTKLQYS